MNARERLIEQFSKFPGVGRRQAERFVYYLLRRNKRGNSELADAITHLQDNMRVCKNSYQFFFTDDPSATLSPIERDTTRDRSTLIVVEKDVDIDAIEKSGAYTGVYFVLGGLLPATNTSAKSYARTDELIQRIERGIADDGLGEIIFGLSLNPESEYTRVEITKQLAPMQQESGLTISRLGRGLSTGTELEYSDRDTLASALETRVS